MLYKKVKGLTRNEWKGISKMKIYKEIVTKGYIRKMKYRKDGSVVYTQDICVKR